MKIYKKMLCVIPVCLILAQASLNHAWAWGAIAVGTSGNFAKDGFAFGGSINQGTDDAAKSAAVDTCRQFKSAPKMAALCNLINTFHNQCYALAFDPKTGAPGVGWHIATDRAGAEQGAMANCKATAGAERQQFCKINQSFCDTHD